MNVGPVFERELLATARSKRTFALRFVYGLVLLALVVAAFRGTPGLVDPHGAIALTRLAFFGRGLFMTLVMVQGVAVIFLTPALVSGAIAGEVQRKTLHDLLTSDLTDAEIILGKLLARLLHVGVFLATGLPILAIAGSLGGLDDWAVVAAFMATLSTAFFLGALSILGSTQTRSARGALNFSLTLALTWLILPGATTVLLPRSGWLGFQLYDWLRPINAWLSASSPFTLWIDSLGRTIPGPSALLERVLWMVGLQVAFGALLAGAAIFFVRRSYRRRGDRGRRRAATSQTPSLLRSDLKAVRRPCGDDPMLWKELFATHSPALYRPLGMLACVVLGSLLVWSTFDFAAPAFRELSASGYGVAPSGSARGAFHFYLRIVGVGLYVVYVLGVASDAAAGLAGEREKDTWISLVSTPLTGVEIIRAKMLGAVWGIRQTACALVGLWLVGVLAGAVHPAGFLAAVAELAVFTWFAAALGTWISLRSDQTMRAVARVTGWLLAINGLGLLAIVPLGAGHPLAFAGCTPFLITASLASYGDVHGTLARSVLSVFSDASLSSLWVARRGEMLLAFVLGMLGYAGAAWYLTRSACLGFDAQLDRPAVLGSNDEPGESSRPASPRPHSAAIRHSRTVGESLVRSRNHP